MKIILSPQIRPDGLVLVKTGETLSINGEVFDFAELGEGEKLSAPDDSTGLFVQAVRSDGDIEVTVIRPIRADASEAVRFPQPLVVNEDGPVTL